jgi:hypothetical protein
MGAAKTRRRTEKWTRKNIVIDQRKLNRAKTILKVSTETDAVDAALDLVVFEGEVLGGIDRLVRAGGLTDPFKKH